jgi:hypothetical protein
VPFVAMRDSDHQLFGRVRTGVFAAGRNDRSIVDAIRARRTIATDGPVVVLMDSVGTICVGDVRRVPDSLTVYARSSLEFGGLVDVRIWKGVLGSKNEELLVRWDPQGAHTWRHEFAVDDLRPHYVRCEALTSPGDRDGHSHRCLTSPVWFGV